MMWQEPMAFAVVAACAAYVGWTLLLPAAWRRRVTQSLLRRHWPAPVKRRLQRAARAASPCGCDGCDARPPRTADRAVRTVHWARRQQR